MMMELMNVLIDAQVDGIHLLMNLDNSTVINVIHLVQTVSEMPTLAHSLAQKTQSGLKVNVFHLAQMVILLMVTLVLNFLILF